MKTKIGWLRDTLVLLVLFSVMSLKSCSKEDGSGWAYVDNQMGFDLYGEYGIIGHIPQGESFVTCETGEMIHIHVAGLNENDWYVYNETKPILSANKNRNFAKKYNSYTFKWWGYTPGSKREDVVEVEETDYKSDWFCLGGVDNYITTTATIWGGKDNVIDSTKEKSVVVWLD